MVAVVPARNEADVIAHSIGSLLAQDYPGPFRVILVDDDSDDGTAEAPARPPPRWAAATGSRSCAGGRCPPAGPASSGRQHQGVEHAARRRGADYLLLTDADIAHAPDNLRRLVARAEAGGYVLVSLMARLHLRDAGPSGC